MATIEIKFQTLVECVEAYEKKTNTISKIILKWLTFGYSNPALIQNIKHLINRNKKWYELVIDALKDGTVKAPWHKDKLADEEVFELFSYLLDAHDGKTKYPGFRPILEAVDKDLLTAFGYLHQASNKEDDKRSNLFSWSNYSKIINNDSLKDAANVISALYTAHLLDNDQAQQNLDRVLNDSTGQHASYYTFLLSCLGNAGLLEQADKAQSYFDAINDKYLNAVSVVVDILCDKGKFVEDAEITQKSFRAITKHTHPAAIANILTLLEDYGLLNDPDYTQTVFDKLVKIKDQSSITYAYRIVELLDATSYLNNTNEAQKAIETIFATHDPDTVYHLHEIIRLLVLMVAGKQAELSKHFINKIVRCQQLETPLAPLMANLTHCIVQQEPIHNTDQAKEIADLVLDNMIDYSDQAEMFSLTIAYLASGGLFDEPEQIGHNLQLLHKFDHFNAAIEVLSCLHDADLITQDNIDALYSEKLNWLVSEEAVPLWNDLSEQGLTQTKLNELLDKAREQGSALLDQYRA